MACSTRYLSSIPTLSLCIAQPYLFHLTTLLSHPHICLPYLCLHCEAAAGSSDGAVAGTCCVGKLQTVEPLLVSGVGGVESWAVDPWAASVRDYELLLLLSSTRTSAPRGDSDWGRRHQRLIAAFKFDAKLRAAGA
uniref:Uncharacterized protein n=1 Tax=Setaria viridis TaxID=4556 RepID=A0A4U6UNZ4_SETVI|nr:hypothetical protein SEVIR_5G038500v2 [Setaria viridis]